MAPLAVQNSSPRPGSAYKPDSVGAGRVRVLKQHLYDALTVQRLLFEGQSSKLH